VIVGAGPAGSTCARTLARAGWDVVIVDRAAFPRDKVCAGWVTPEVFDLLDLTPAAYRDAGLTLQEISAFRTGLIDGPARDTSYGHVVSYAIRRWEFDRFLLDRAGSRTLERTPAETLRRSGGRWIVNDAIAAPVVIGAGGHFCPVARHLRGGRDTTHPVVAREAEFPLAGGRANVELTSLYFCRDLDGYGWCVPKGGYLNVGLGHRDARRFPMEFARFVAFLERTRTIDDASALRWRGHAYLASGAGTRPLAGDGVLLIGDAAGLAYPESGEGIRPAIESGLLAAQTLVAAGGRVEREALQPYADALLRRHPPASRYPAAVRGAASALAPLLLSSARFTRRVVLDRWFLRPSPQATAVARVLKAANPCV
jgi:geranylgeranyl reductase family protein